MNKNIIALEGIKYGDYNEKAGLYNENYVTYLFDRKDVEDYLNNNEADNMTVEEFKYEVYTTDDTAELLECYDYLTEEERETIISYMAQEQAKGSFDGFPEENTDFSKSSIADLVYYRDEWLPQLKDNGGEENE